MPQDNLEVTPDHLAILNFKVSSMDWLELSPDGHRRAKLTPAGLLEWLVP